MGADSGGNFHRARFMTFSDFGSGLMNLEMDLLRERRSDFLFQSKCHSMINDDPRKFGVRCGGDH